MRSIIQFLCTGGAIAPFLVAAQGFNTRNDYLGLHGSEVGWAIERTFSGYVVYQGYSPDTSSGAWVGFSALDQDGDVLSSWSFGRDTIVSTPGWANSLDQLADAGYVACGTTDSAQVNHAIVWRFDANGDSVWTRQLFNGAGYASLGWMAKGLEDGSLVVTGQVFPPDSWSQAFLMKFGPEGDSVWSRTYGGGATDASYSVDLTEDGGFVLGGYTTSYDGGDQQTYVVRADSMGNQIWYKTLGSNEEDCIGDVTVTANGDILVVGCRTQYESNGTYYERSYAARLSNGGDILWQRQYGPTDPWNSISAARELADGSFISPGAWLAGPGTGPKGTLLKFAANGDSLWMRQYDHPSTTGWLRWHVLKDLVLEADGGVTACGYLADTTNQDLWVIRVDSFGCLVPGCQQFDNIDQQGLELNVLVYPNPTQGRLFLSFRSALPPSGGFTLVNSAGQVARYFPPGSSSVEIDLDISEQPAGLYLLKYTDEQGTRWESKVIKE